MSTRTTELLLLEDLEDDGRTGGLAAQDRAALRAVGDWIRTFITQPHAQLGRPGSVCPYVPKSIERKEHWLAAEHVGEAGVPDVVELLQGYRRRLLDAAPPADGGPDLHVIVVVFPDLPAARAQGLFADVLQQIALPAFAEDGVVFGPFYDGNPGTAIYNAGFHPFRSPVPFVFVRHGVVSDWKFFLDSDEMLAAWARRFGESAVHALAGELRRMPWRTPEPTPAVQVQQRAASG